MAFCGKTSVGVGPGKGGFVNFVRLFGGGPTPRQKAHPPTAFRNGVGVQRFAQSVERFEFFFDGAQFRNEVCLVFR